MQKGDIVVCEAGDVIPADGDVIEGIASVDEAAITGESAPVIRESGGDRSAVTGGTRVLSDRIVIRITMDKGHGFLDRMIALVEGAKRQKTPNEIALTILLAALTFIFLLVCVTLKPFGIYSGAVFSVPVLIALLVCLIPTTIGGLLSAIGIAGMDRVLQRNVLAMSGRPSKPPATWTCCCSTRPARSRSAIAWPRRFCPRPSVKTGTSGRRRATRVARGRNAGRPQHCRCWPRSNSTCARRDVAEPHAKFVSVHRADAHERRGFSRGGGGVSRPGSFAKARRMRFVFMWIEQGGQTFPRKSSQGVDEISRSGGTPLVVAEGREVLGVVHLKDVVKGGIKERFAHLRKMGIRTVMITGDNPLTAAAIAAEAGVDDFMAQATPEQKLKRIREEQAAGHLVAMTGDGTNDAPALAQADVGVAMNTGTQAAREAGNMVDLDSNPTKLIDIVEIGKQMLITRGSLTTFSIANDVAKYFAIIPAMLMATFPAIAPLNIMRLHSPTSAILSAVIFNALIIIALIPLALRGVKYTPIGALATLQRNLLIYGLGGVIIPFIGIKLIDVIITDSLDSSELMKELIL